MKKNYTCINNIKNMSNKTKISSIGYCFEKKQPNFKTENLKLTSLGFKNIKIKKCISRQA